MIAHATTTEEIKTTQKSCNNNYVNLFARKKKMNRHHEIDLHVLRITCLRS